MSVIVVGLEQRQSPLELLERVAVPESALPKALGRLRDQSNLSEAVILSTCLRTEVYAVVERFHDGVAELQEFLATISGCPVDVLADHLIAGHTRGQALGGHLGRAVRRRRVELTEESRLALGCGDDTFPHRGQQSAEVEALVV